MSRPVTRAPERLRAKAAAALPARLGHSFATPALLDEALTHGSATGPDAPDNQRLEFLGDRVLGLIIAEELHRRHPTAREGALHARLTALVCEETCAAVAESIELGAALRLGRSEATTGGRRKQALLGDAIEAVIAAVYLDGGLQAARRAVLTLWGPRLETPAAARPTRDAKSRLNERAQAQGEPPPAYTLVARDGPDHAPRFEVEARLAGGAAARGEGVTKQAAEKAAAAALLAQLDGATTAEIDA